MALIRTPVTWVNFVHVSHCVELYLWNFGVKDLFTFGVPILRLYDLQRKDLLISSKVILYLTLQFPNLSFRSIN
ncbi:10870_t:CDS:2 [Entrophospora sp. SA101]|nr:10870_t:CDS:2 [Entrophospora sp. SA101]